MTTFSVNNISKETPPKAKILGNALIMFALAIQPLIVGAPADVMGDVGKFWTSIGLTIVGLAGKVITMMFGIKDESLEQIN